MSNMKLKFRKETAKLVEYLGLDAIATYFDIGKFVDKPFLIQTGMSNLSYELNTTKGYYICKIFPSLDLKQMQNDAIIHSQLSVAGIDSPKYMFGPNEEYVYYNQLFVAVVYNRIGGINIPKIDADYCYSMGRVLALFHGHVSKLAHKKIALLNQNWVINKWSLIRSKDMPFVDSLLLAYTKGRTLFEDNLTTGIVHGDFHEGNILVDEHMHSRIVGVLDFERSEKNVLIVDLARTALGICRGVNEDVIDPLLFKALFLGYNSVRKLNENEVKNMEKALIYAAGIGGLWLICYGIDPLPLATQLLSRAESIIADGGFKEIIERNSTS